MSAALHYAPRLSEAERLGEEIAERFAEGRLSYSKVRAMTRVAHAENEEFLLMVAKHGAASHVERLVSQYRRVEKLNRPDAAQEIFEQREVTYYYDDDGCLVMKAKSNTKVPLPRAAPMLSPRSPRPT